MKVSYSKLAFAEFEESVIWYEEQRSGLGREFRMSILETVKNIKATPLAGRAIRRGLRTWINQKFSYKVAYKIKDEVIIIVRIWHAARNITLP